MSVVNPAYLKQTTRKEWLCTWWCMDASDSLWGSLSPPVIFDGVKKPPDKYHLWKPRYKPPQEERRGVPVRAYISSASCSYHGVNRSVSWRGGGRIVPIDKNFKTCNRSHFNEVRRDNQTHAGMLCLKERNPQVMAEGRCLPETHLCSSVQKGRSVLRNAINQNKGIKTHNNPRKEKLCYQSIQIQQQPMQRLI